MHLLPGHGRRVGQPRAGARRARPRQALAHGQARADRDARGPRHGDRAHRPRGDGDHDLQRALQHRPPLPVDRPYQRRPRRLEPGDLADRGRSRRISASTSTWRMPSATSAPRNSTRSSPACGTAGRTTPCCATRQSGLYMDRDKVHFLDHVGKHFKVKGPLNITRSPQGWPVIAQAGSSEAGRELAARTADVVFTRADQDRRGQGLLRRHQAARGDVRPRARRHQDHARPDAGARPHDGTRRSENYEYLQSLMPDDVALLSLSHISGGLDLTKFPLDGPLPELPPSNAAKAPPGAGGEDRAREQHDPAPDRPPHRGRHRPSRDRRHGRVHGRRDGEVAQGRGGRRLQRRLQPLSQAVRGFLPAGRARAAAARHLPHRVRRHDACARIRAQEFRRTDTPGGTRCKEAS